jgi:alpha-glucosidase
MLADIPTNYIREQECTDFITSVPVVWDETVVLSGKVGEYVVLARRKGDVWYLGALTNSESREITIDLKFLDGGNYYATVFKDGVNADRNSMDYKRGEETFIDTDMLTIKMAPGGGWAARIEKRD